MHVRAGSMPVAAKPVAPIASSTVSSTASSSDFFEQNRFEVEFLRPHSVKVAAKLSSSEHFRAFERPGGSETKYIRGLEVPKPRILRGF